MITITTCLCDSDYVVKQYSKVLPNAVTNTICFLEYSNSINSMCCTSPGLLVYFGYGIWHSKEGLREMQPKDMAARYVVLPSGSLVETVQSVQPNGQHDASTLHTTPSRSAEEQQAKR